GDGGRAAIAEREVVLLGAALVGVALDARLHLAIALEAGGRRRQTRAILLGDLARVVVEVHAHAAGTGLIAGVSVHVAGDVHARLGLWLVSASGQRECEQRGAESDDPHSGLLSDDSREPPRDQSYRCRLLCANFLAKYFVAYIDRNASRAAVSVRSI